LLLQVTLTNNAFTITIFIIAASSNWGEDADNNNDMDGEEQV